MATLSVGQKVVMHLNRYKHIDSEEIYNVPWELTQDGIAAALRISRAHASIELKKLRENKKVDEYLVHVKNGKSKRKVYMLTSLGLQDVPVIEEFARKENIDIDALLDLKKQDPKLLLGELGEEDRYAFGCACAFRVPVPISVLPQTKNFVIPSDLSGNTVISAQLRENVLKSADEDEIINWMTYAGNVWLDDKDNRKIGDEAEYAEERLYHLVTAGAITSACRHISNEGPVLSFYTNEDIGELLDIIEDVPAKFAKDVYPVKIEVAEYLGEYTKAKGLIEKLRTVSPTYATIYEADIAYYEGSVERARELITSISEECPAAKTRLGKYLIDEGKYDEAEELLMSLTITDDSDAYIGVEKFIQLARICHARNDDAEAYHKLMKARATFSDEALKKRINIIAKSYDINKGLH